MARSIKSKIGPSAEDPHIVIGAQSNDHSAHLAGVSSKLFFTDALTFTRAQLMVSEYYQLDVPSNFWDVYNIEAEALGQKIVFQPNGIPDTDRTEPLIQKPEPCSFRNSEKKKFFGFHGGKGDPVDG